MKRLLTISLAVFLALGVSIVPLPINEVFAANNIIYNNIFYVDASATGDNGGGSWGNAYTDLQDALADAVSGDEIWVAAGTYKPTSEYIDETSRLFTFQLVSGVALYGGFIGGETSLEQRDWEANLTILSGDIGTAGDTSDNSYHVVVGADNAILDGFTITGGNATGADKYKRGGGMYNYGSSPTVTNCTFSENRASYGGGMYNFNSSPTVTNCTFSGNSAENGGGMCNYGSSPSPTVTNCTFSGNSAERGGGGMYNYSSSPTVTNCTFSGNSADSAGSGMSNNSSSSPTVTNCTFSGNSAVITGGGMYNRSSSPTVTGCYFSGNSAYSGGGMYNYSSSPTVTNCTFSGNSAVDYYGGGMYNYGSSPTVTSCTFSGNSAVYGGGMSNLDSSSPTVTNCTFSGNSAGYYGGGMFNLNSSPTVTDCIFSGNSVGDDGGGMFNNSSSSPTVTNCTFSGNSAVYGGGMYNTRSSSPTVTNCTFSGNSAINTGGGMLNLDSSSPAVTNCYFSGNSAEKGGGMSNYSSSPTVTNCTFSGNSAGYYGGGMFNNGSSPTVTNCTFSGNSADYYGGGMYNSDSSSPTVTNCILWGDSAATGPEIYPSWKSVTYCDVEGGYIGDGNIATDPLFADPINGDFHLLTGSPCIDAGNNDAVPEWLTTDFEGDDRIMGAAVDMGIDEFAPTAANQPPVAEDDSATTDEDTAVTISVLANDIDPDEDDLTVSEVTQSADGSVVINAGDSVTYTPNADFYGEDSFTYTASDSKGGTDTATVTVTVTAVNDAPVADDQEVTPDEDTPVAITLTASDAEEDTLTYTIVDSPANGSLSGTAPELTYTPDVDYNGNDSFTFKVNDGTVDSNVATVSITVNPINDAPVADDQSVTTGEDTSVDITLTASDAEADTITYTVVDSPTNGSLSGTAPELTYTPDADYNGPDSFTFKANDGTVDSNVATVSITVNPLIIQVTIDIKPGSDPNSINLKSKGVVPVAVLTTDDFDAGEVDPATVVFASAEPERWTSEDVDGDGNLDLLFHFRTQELDLTEDSEDATLTGKTTDGHEITGTDSVRIVPQKGKK